MRKKFVLDRRNVWRDGVMRDVTIELNRSGDYGLILRADGEVVGEARIYTQEDIDEIHRDLTST